jgi:putative transcriptional regulator
MELFDYTDKNLIPQKGDLLISEPFLADPNFARTVILLCEHNEEGSFGFVLNKPSSVQLGDAVQEFDGAAFEVFVGGPVQQDTLHFIHRQGDMIEGSIEIRDGLYWGGDFEQLKFLVNENMIKEDDFKFFIGYSGWSEGQLMEEMNLKSWIISRNVNIEQVFDTDTETLWQEVLQMMGGKYKIISNFPVDPRLN